MRVEPDKILRAVCDSVDAIDDDIRRLIEQMVVCMDTYKGIGLAAPQVGRTHRLFVTHAPQDQVRVFINPTILSTSQDQVEIQEGCLSIPETYGFVVRSRNVTVQAYDQRGAPFVLEATGMVARVILHEHDHLEGVLFWDHLTPKKRRKLQAQYRAP